MLESEFFNPRQSRGLTRRRATNATRGFTLVEMLVAMGITLVMMAAVVTLFANVSGSVRNRRATIEMSGQLRHVRNMLQQDLQGATCPGLTWQRPESNHGYIELIEGQYREGNASILIDGTDDPATFNPEIDPRTSILPSSNLPLADANSATDGAGLGDYDDILMLTVRNEHEPFVGRVPSNVRLSRTRTNRFDAWRDDATIESTLAEVVWFAVENPAAAENGDNFFGEPGMRTIYRRALLIAPWVNPYRFVESGPGNSIVVTDTFMDDSQRFKAEPGLVRLLPEDTPEEQAFAALVAFQERYDLSVRLEWDHSLGEAGRWKIVANTLGDLTKRENRYEHHSFQPTTKTRRYPYAAASLGSGYQGSRPGVICWPDPESPDPPYLSPAPPYTEGRAELKDIAERLTDIDDLVTVRNAVVAYSLQLPYPTDPMVVRQKYKWRPFAFVEGDSQTLATARVMLNDKEEVVRIVHGLVPLSNERRGEDVMMTDALAFDLRVYDPGAPLYAMREDATDPNSAIQLILEPGDIGWQVAYNADVPDINANLDGTTAFPLVGQGSFVDLGYGFGRLIPKNFFASASNGTAPWFFTSRLHLDIVQFGYRSTATAHYVQDAGSLTDVFSNVLAPGYAVYDTWSFHYENNGVNEDADVTPSNQPLIDEGTNGIEDVGHYVNPSTGRIATQTGLGVDDAGERETLPPYDKPLRGIQVIMRAYERDSRAIRQVRVNQHFMPE